MSRENVELHHRVLDAFNRRDLDAVLALMDGNVEANSRLVAIEGGYHGHDGIRRWWANLLDAWPDFTIEVFEVRDLGERTLAVVRNRGRGAGSDIPIEQRLWQVAEWRDKKVVWWSSHEAEAEALEAVQRRDSTISQDDLDLIRENFARFQAGDSGWKDLIHPEIEWDFSAYPLADIPTRGRGREDVLTKVIATYYSGWRGYEAEITELAQAGDEVLVVQHEVVRVADSDQPLSRDTFHVWTVRDRMWIRWRIFPDRESALEAAGLRE